MKIYDKTKHKEQVREDNGLSRFRSQALKHRSLWSVQLCSAPATLIIGTKVNSPQQTYHSLVKILNKKNKTKQKTFCLELGTFTCTLNTFLIPVTPNMTFEVKLLKTFVATYPLVILAKFSQNRMKHVEAEAN